ncbi:AbrB/MazE/SpoVT family DNA-binding domain-containing protein [Deinococcus sp. NW-56]|uniref:AbrB/MazE/SpoVT family DNA-binding domain-containing protein n=1 Tax=Deinococcus sp. NW-56 TaxID=2080419 RepID=UPI001319D207|nr:AbrB/MazE/SpoVT family DNA-binding domain-containing protein [Deinococcus sp. NW-56]
MKIITATVGDEGEVTLPPEVLERLGVREGQEVEDDEGVHLRPPGKSSTETEAESSG